MNILVVMPRFVNKSSDGYVFPLGLPYISSNLKKAGFHVYTLNLNHYDDEVSNLLEKQIHNNQIEILFTGGLSSQYSVVRQVVESAKKIKRSLITVVGGGLISAEPEIAMTALEYADIGIIGEGEITCVELCKALKKKLPVSEVAGIIYNNKGTSFQVTESRKEITDIDTIPWPDYEGFELDKNLSNMAGMFGFGNKRLLYLISSRSCPFSCTFCFHTTGKKYRQRSIENFFIELDYLIPKYNVEAIFLSDELFALNIERVREFCLRIINYDITWSAAFRVDSITPEILNLIKETNSCSEILLGLESADDRILKSMNKKITRKQIDYALNLCYDYGLAIQGQFIFGDIAETVETSDTTISWLETNQDKFGLKINHVIAYPGTAIYKYACEEGLIKDKIRFLRDGCPQINISKMSDLEYNTLIGKIANLVSSPSNTLLNYCIFDINAQYGFISVKGNCTVCGSSNEWNEIRLFQPSYLICKNCGQKYSPPITDRALISNIENNIIQYVKKRGKVAIWGMQEHMIAIFSHSEQLYDNRIYPIDLSLSKQGTKLLGKTIYSPDIIKIENIDTVVISAPWYYGIIYSTIKMNFPNVVHIKSIINFIGENLN